MFFCKECADKNNWPESMMISYGKCEMCGGTRSCYDVPSKFLPQRSQPEDQ